MRIALVSEGGTRASGLAGSDARAEVQPWRLMVAGCLALSAFSLLTYTEPTYDPYAWIKWGREITELDLSTTYGPSWKPLPIFFTVPFALFGDAAPDLWVWIARAGGLLGAALAFRLAARWTPGPRWARAAGGAFAAVALLCADGLARYFVRGNSEGLLVGVSLWALERHLDGRRDHAFALGFAAALLRPELWPFWGLYGLWLARDRGKRVLVGALFAANAALWLLPEWWGSGDPFRAASRAQSANPGQPKFAEFPFGEALRQTGDMLGAIVLAGAAIGIVAALRRRDRAQLAVAALAAAIILEVALMAQAGFAGNVRYVAAATGIVCALAGAGLARVHPAVAVAAAALVIGLAYSTLREDMRAVRAEADFYGSLPVVIDRAGGPQAVRDCGRIFTGPFQVQAVSWHLHVHGKEVELSPTPPGTILAPRGSRLARDDRFPKVAESAQWIVKQACVG